MLIQNIGECWNYSTNFLATVTNTTCRFSILWCLFLCFVSLMLFVWYICACMIQSRATHVSGAVLRLIAFVIVRGDTSYMCTCTLQFCITVTFVKSFHKKNKDKRTDHFCQCISFICLILCSTSTTLFFETSFHCGILNVNCDNESVKT